MAQSSSPNNKNTTFFQDLTRLFRQGPLIRRKIKAGVQPAANNIDTKSPINNLGNYGFGSFRRAVSSPFSTQGTYGQIDREIRYAEYQDMEYYSETSKALDLYADETCSGDENGRCFHVFSDSPEIQRSLEELFYDICNADFDLRRWVRDFCKYGECYLHVEVEPNEGVTGITPLSVNDVDREEGFDEKNKSAVRFKVKSAMSNSRYLENWQVLHFRRVGNDWFLPYGTSLLEPARRPWRQLILMEDAMMVYRLIRSPERRVFYIDVTGIKPEQVPNFMEQVESSMKRNISVDRLTGRSDLRHAALDPLDDYFLPTRPNNLTKIESLPGAQHITAIEDIEYIQRKLTAALGIPRAYLSYDDGLGSKASLSQEDIRFARTINNIQKVIIAELNQLAVLHLYAQGFDGEDLVNFELKLSSPSTLAVQQKLNLWAQKFEVADAAKQSELVNEEWIMSNILELRKDDIIQIFAGKERDVIRNKTLDALEPPNPKDKTTDDAILNPFDPTNYQVPSTTGKENTDDGQQSVSGSITLTPLFPPYMNKVTQQSTFNPDTLPIKTNYQPQGFMKTMFGEEQSTKTGLLGSILTEDLKTGFEFKQKNSFIGKVLREKLNAFKVSKQLNTNSKSEIVFDLQIINENIK